MSLRATCGGLFVTKNKMSVKENKLQFVRSQIFSLTISAAFRQGRGSPVYKENVAEEGKKNFHSFLKNRREDYGSIYKNVIDGNQHIKNIKNLQAEINEIYAPILDSNNLAFGRVQKLLNLYLKYLWTLNMILTPPHCPFDYIIISELKTDVPNWTKQSFTEKDYKKLVDLAENKLKNIAEWELEFWNQYLEK